MKKISLILIAFVVGGFVGWWCVPVAPTPAPVVHYDTVLRVDTVPVPIPTPQRVEVVRYDTVILKDMVTLLARDTVVLPLERAYYQTELYRATIEGIKPKLIHLEVYPRTTTVTRTVTKTKTPRWALTVGGGLGYTPKGVQPYVGVSFGYVLWCK